MICSRVDHLIEHSSPPAVALSAVEEGFSNKGMTFSDITARTRSSGLKEKVHGFGSALQTGPQVFLAPFDEGFISLELKARGTQETGYLGRGLNAFKPGLLSRSVPTLLFFLMEHLDLEIT